MKKLTLLSLLFLTLFACREDIETEVSSTTTTQDPTITVIDYEEEVIPVTASLFGTVTDENDVPLSNIAVTLGSNTETTDDNGRFLFKEITMNAAGTLVKANANGYFPGSYRFFPKDGSVNYATLTLLSKPNTGNFVSTDGGVVTSPDGIQLEFPANSVVTGNGSTYEGTVEVAARWIDPTAENLAAIMPGGLQGINQDAEEVALASFGMMAVELEAPNGQSLNLGNDQKATLTFPIPDELMGTAPAEIPLWYFSEEYGIWVIEGTATKQGDQYVGDVSHFSFWNCDAPFPLVEFTARFVSESGAPIPNTWVQLQIVSSGWTASGWTNDDGVVSGKVPKDEELIMVVYQANACEVYSENIGPFSDDVDLGDIVIDSPVMLDITGTIVDCNNDAVSNGWVSITVGTQTYTFYVENGNDISLSVFNCDDVDEVTVVAGNLDDLEVSDELVYSVTDPLDLGNVQACGNTLNEYLILTVDGATTTFVDVSLFIETDSLTFFSGGLPGTDYNYSVYTDEFTSTGTYGGDIVQFAFGFVPSGSGDVFVECGNNPGGPNNCGFTEIVVTEFGNVGEVVAGTFSGDGNFFDQNQQTVTLPFSGEFRIIRQ